MDDLTTAVSDYFSKLNLPHEAGTVYLSLYVHGGQTISELARNSGVERTRIYRLLPQLQAANLIEIDSQYKHSIIRAAPIDNLQIMLAQKEQQLAELKAQLPLLEAAIAAGSTTSKQTQVRFYQGESGVKQMLWNETKANSEIVSILSEAIQLKTKSKFFERWADKSNQRQLTFRSVVNESFIHKQMGWHQLYSGLRLDNWQGRVISSSQFPIEYSTIIYDDILGYFYWQDDEVFGVEIENRHLASGQRRLFELLWQSSSPQTSQ